MDLPSIHDKSSPRLNPTHRNNTRLVPQNQFRAKCRVLKFPLCDHVMGGSQPVVVGEGALSCYWCDPRRAMRQQLKRLEKLSLEQWLQPRQESGSDCLHCAEFARRRLLGRGPCRGTSLTRNTPPVGPYSRHMPRALI
jgi:hypothetical protein